MYLDTRTGRINADRISPADLYFGIRLGEMAWRGMPAIMAVLALALLAPAYVVWQCLVSYDGMDVDDAAGYGLGVAAVLWVLFCIGLRRRVVARRAVRAAAYEAARLEAARPLRIEDVVPGMVSNPPPNVDWFDAAGNRLRFNRDTAEWRYENTNASPTSSTSTLKTGLSASREERI